MHLKRGIASIILMCFHFESFRFDFVVCCSCCHGGGGGRFVFVFFLLFLLLLVESRVPRSPLFLFAFVLLLVVRFFVHRHIDCPLEARFRVYVVAACVLAFVCVCMDRHNIAAIAIAMCIYAELFHVWIYVFCIILFSRVVDWNRYARFSSQSLWLSLSLSLYLY